MTAPIESTAPEDWINTHSIVCRDVRGAAARPVVLSASQFRRLPIPPARIRIQPDPRRRDTLINIETNLYTEARQPVLTTTVLGAPVRVRASPASYRWVYGDGAVRSTSSPGHAYPDMPTAHVYRKPGTYPVRLTTTFTGEFSVRGGPWQPVQGTASVTTRPVTVTAVEARAHLVE